MPGPARARRLAAGLGAADAATYRAVRRRAVHPHVVGTCQRLSQFGEHALGWLAIGAAAAILDGDRRPAWLRATASVAAAHGANVAIKHVVRRPRPAFDDLPHLGATPSRLSFPSAHAASSFAAAAAFGPLAPGLPWRTGAVAMGLSRVLLGVHYPADVLAGAALGTAVGRGARTASVRSEDDEPLA